ncbi:MAG: OmpA family protein [Bacteroidetes bacterium]|nr:OmpA family protein [Bacteroidota bacterium]
MIKSLILNIFLSSLFCFPVIICAQEVEEKQIRLTEESLTQIVKKIVDAKQQSLQKNISKKNDKDLASNEVSKQSKADLELQIYSQKIEALEDALNSKEATRGTNNYVDRLNELKGNAELMSLKNEINYLKELVKQKSSPQTQPIIINSSNPNGSGTKDSKAIPNNEVEAIKNQLDSLLKQTKLTDSKIENDNKATEKDYTDDLNILKNKIKNLQASLKNKYFEQDKFSNYERLNRVYGEFEQKILFANNSKSIQSKYFKDIDTLVSTLKNNEKVDVLIKGFASKKGNPVYNQDLSMQRTEAIKQQLISKGVHPTRILTSYHGIDYNATSESDARRVEISYIIRK